MTQPQPDLDAVARAILDAHHYMTLGTVDAGGRPWVSPVFFAAGARAKAHADVLGPSLYRLYRATVSAHWVLDPEAAPDQRTPVSP